MKPKNQSHTPGPWNVGEVTRSNGHSITWKHPDPKNAGKLWVAETHETVYADGSDGSEEANARLIAASPTLLEALRMLIMAVGTEHQDRALAEAVKAIESAEGK